MKNDEQELDELDIKFFSEFGFLIDVFTSCFNKLRENILYHFKDIEEHLYKFVNKNLFWEIKNEADCFTPFYLSWDKPKNPQLLPNKFTFTKSVKVKTKKEQDAREFLIACGFWYEMGEPFLYFGIYKYKIDTDMLPLSFYNSLNVSNYEKVINHPDEESKDESIEIFIYKINNDELKKGFQIFLHNIVKPYLKEIESLDYKK